MSNKLLFSRQADPELCCKSTTAGGTEAPLAATDSMGLQPAPTDTGEDINQNMRYVQWSDVSA